jgi:hypothetical protein
MKRQLVAIGVAWIATIAVASCSGPTPTGIVVSREFRPFVSADASMLISADLGKLRSSPLYAKYQRELNLPALDEITQEFGVDPRRDLNELLYVATGEKQYLLARVVFQVQDLEARLQRKGLTKSAYKGFAIWGDARNAVAFRKGSVLLMGSTETLRSAIDTEDGGRGEVPEEIADRLRGMPKGDQIWLVSRNGLPFVGTPTRSDIQSALSNIVAFIKAAAASLSIEDGLRLRAALGCVSQDGATRVNDALRGAVAIGRLSTKDNETALLKIYDAVQIERQENTVRVNAQLSGDQIQELANRFGSR